MARIVCVCPYASNKMLTSCMYMPIKHLVTVIVRMPVTYLLTACMYADYKCNDCVLVCRLQMYCLCVCKPVTHFSTACLYAGYTFIDVVFVSRYTFIDCVYVCRLQMYWLCVCDTVTLFLFSHVYISANMCRDKKRKYVKEDKRWIQRTIERNKYGAKKDEDVAWRIK